MSFLSIKPTRQGATLRIALEGQIDEAADYSGVALAGAQRVIFDFEGVRLINSTGLQHWIKFLASFPAGIEIVFSRCSIRVISQLNMFPGFLAGRAVTFESFFAPYFCEACDQSLDVLVANAEHASGLSRSEAPKMQCPRCRGVADFDGIEAKYFQFLQAG